ncbi:MAG: hypothetical protein CSB16_01490 [Clostridiales bacterium]|nr:MAG: hypothetical protein CSB16_01490 [Clostridiales bacterium]
MSRLKRLSIISIFWNLIMLALLFFQSRVLKSIIQDKVFPGDDTLGTVLEGNYLDVLKNRAIDAAIVVGIIIVVQIILFFVVNFLFCRKLKKLNKAEVEIKESKHLEKYYRYIMIYMLVFLIVFLSFAVFSGLKISNLANEMDFKIDEGSLFVLGGIVVDIKSNGLPTLKEFINDALDVFSDSPDIKQFLSTAFGRLNTLISIEKYWHIISYIILAFGMFLSTRLLASKS